MQEKGHIISEVAPGSIAEELELVPGDKLLQINGQEVEDIFDYEYQVDSESMVMLVEKADGELWELEIENDYEDIGLTFENGLMSDYRSCSNKCIFCFIDQMPPGMRETLYFKDDDTRLSFLQGNYVSLTNLKERDIDRIIKFKLAPINVSVHTTNPELRCRMLNNRFAGKTLSYIDRLYEAQTPMNGQVVLCRGVNDGAELDRTIRDLSKYIPVMESLSIVPVGLSRYRDGLYPLEPFTKEDAEAVLDLIEGWQKHIYEQYGIHFVHASDEFYLLAGRELPEEERYDGYIQLENGVGMLRLLDTEVTEALDKLIPDEVPAECRREEISIATGVLAAPYIQKQAKKLQKLFPEKIIQVHTIYNKFFGESITVSGLVTGQDIMEQLKDKKLGSRLLLPLNMFRSGEEVFLDDVTKSDVQNALQVPVDIVKSSGQDLVEAMLYPTAEEYPAYEGYELKEI